ncbi:MAG: pectin acetylesterase-family hydrolase [Bacteroidetes bacterium]|nr:pectin acetylesterase-family hydrolase [Bacteroidota bacterium]
MKFQIYSRYLLLLLFSIWFVSCGEDEAPVLEPLDLAYENDIEWHWVPKEEMISRIGISSGYGVNFNSNSSKLLIYLEGGGACFNAVTCFDNPSKFDQNDFEQGIMGGQGSLGIYNRNSSQNPFSDWNYVYIPYSTGDIHGGNNPSSDVPGGASNQKMVGFNNVTEVLNDIAPFLLDKGVTEVFLSGSSAGGYGALINYDQVAQVFPDIDISMIADSSPVFFDTDIFPSCFNDRLETTFNLQFPPDYDSFVTDEFPYDTQRMYEYLSNKYPDAQFGFFGYYEDPVMAFFFGFGQDDCVDGISPIPNDIYKEGLLDIADYLEDELGNWRVYYETGEQHTILFSSDFESMSVSDVRFTDWLSDLNQKTAQDVIR